jgi:hypothetical protein
MSNPNLSSMFNSKFNKKLALSSFAAAIALNCASSVVQPSPSIAQTGSGIILFGNVRDKALTYNLENGRARSDDRYFLEIPAQKFRVAQILVTYPVSYQGEFDPTAIDLRVNDKNLPLESAKWDKESRVVEVIPKEAIPANRAVKLVLHNVRNPTFGGLFQFDGRVLGADDVPLLRYIGSWVIGID